MQEEKALSEIKVKEARSEVTYCGLGKKGLEAIRRLVGVLDENMVLLRVREDVVGLVEDVLAAEKFLDCVSHSEYRAPLISIAKETGVEEDCIRRFIRSFKELPLQDLLGVDVCLISTKGQPSQQE